MDALVLRSDARAAHVESEGPDVLADYAGRFTYLCVRVHIRGRLVCLRPVSLSEGPKRGAHRLLAKADVCNLRPICTGEPGATHLGMAASSSVEGGNFGLAIGDAPDVDHAAGRDAAAAGDVRLEQER